MTTSDVLSVLMVGGLMGLVGQGARAAIGLKKMNDLASNQDVGWNSVFDASRLIISMAIGFLAGVIAAITIGVDTISNAITQDILVKLAAAGYAGTDAIEAFTANLGSSGTSTTSQKAGANLLSDAGTANLTEKISSLNVSLSSLSGSLARFNAPPVVSGSKDASPAELAQDMQEARKYYSAIREAAAKYNLAPSLICAIGSRESGWGQGRDMKPKGPGGTGDWKPRNPQKWGGHAMPPDGLGWGRGLMQVDYGEGDFGKTGDWMDPTANILFGSNELEDNIKHFTVHPLPGVDPLSAAVAAYNCGQTGVANSVAGGFDVDYGTAGGDYSQDVLGRANWFKSNGFDKLSLVS